MQARFRQILVFMLVGAMLALAVPTSAFAGESTYRMIWGPNVVPGPSGGGGGGHPIDGGTGSAGGAGTTFAGDSSGSLYGVMVYAPNRYAAAMLVCGVAWNDPRIDHDKRMALSNADAGGDFYTFAQRFSTISDGSGSFTVPDFYGNAYKNENMLFGVCSTYSKMYKPVNIYAAIYDNTQYMQGKNKLNEILDGDGSGTGSDGSTTDGTYVFFTANNVYDEGKAGDTQTGGIAFTTEQWNELKNYQDENMDGWHLYFSVGGMDSTNYNGLDIGIFQVKPVIESSTRVLWPGTGKMSNTFDVPPDYVNNPNKYTVHNDFKYYLITSANLNTLKSVRNADTTRSSVRPLVKYYWNGDSETGDGSGGGGSGGGGNEGDWPDDDPIVEPEPPELPTPRDPTIPVEPTDPIVTDTPAPSLPDPTDPTIPVIGNPTDDNNFTVDLQGILDALNEHCIHLQQRMTIVGDYVASSFQKSINDMISANNTALQTYAGNIVTNMHTEMFATRSVIGSKIGWLIDDINECFGVLMEYLEDLWGFLDEKLDFSFTGYNDDSLMGWLEKIYMKLGSGIDTTPVDPVSDPDGSGDWLSQLLASFFGALLGSLASVLGEATSAMATLATKFPFSIPWDIMAILGLLVAPPVCPDVTVPCYSLTASGLQQVGSYEIDLEDIEFAVEGIRWMLRVGFILLLLSRTKDFMQIIEGVID